MRLTLYHCMFMSNDLWELWKCETCKTPVFDFIELTHMLSVFSEKFHRDKDVALYTLHVYFFICLCALKTFMERYK